IAALVPVFTLEQVEGRIFRPLALTYSFALVAALLLALTLVPALCAVGFAAGKARAEPAWITGLRARYRGGLMRLMPLRILAIGMASVFLAMTLWVGAKMGTEFLPELDEGDIVVFVEMPPSIALEAAQTMLVEVRRRILTFRGRAGVVGEWPPRGRHRQREPEHERDLRAPQAARGMAQGLRQGSADRRDARSGLRDPWGALQLLPADQGQRRGGGGRGARQGRAQDLRHRDEGDARHAGAGAPEARAG